MEVQVTGDGGPGGPDVLMCKMEAITIPTIELLQRLGKIIPSLCIKPPNHQLLLPTIQKDSLKIMEKIVHICGDSLYYSLYFYIHLKLSTLRRKQKETLTRQVLCVTSNQDISTCRLIGIMIAT